MRKWKRSWNIWEGKREERDWFPEFAGCFSAVRPNVPHMYTFSSFFFKKKLGLLIGWDKTDFRVRANFAPFKKRTLILTFLDQPLFLQLDTSVFRDKGEGSKCDSPPLLPNPTHLARRRRQRTNGQGKDHFRCTKKISAGEEEEEGRISTEKLRGKEEGATNVNTIRRGKICLAGGGGGVAWCQVEEGVGKSIPFSLFLSVANLSISHCPLPLPICCCYLLLM